MKNTNFAQLANSCQHKMKAERQRRPVNGLNIEYGGGSEHCLLQSPDGRGLVWLMSGGNVLAYGLCRASACPLLKVPTE